MIKPENAEIMAKELVVKKFKEQKKDDYAKFSKKCTVLCKVLCWDVHHMS